MRFFVAIPVPLEVAAPLAGALDPIRERHDGLRWTGPGTWHVTLAFLGDVDQRPDEVAATLRPALDGWEGVDLRLAGGGRFDSAVLWLGVDDDPPGTLRSASTRLQEAAIGAGHPVHRRELEAHLTLARAGRDRVADDAVAALDGLEGAWTAPDVILFASDHDGPRVRHHRVATLASVSEG